ncbi:alanine--tRNA ligase [Helicobacter magdeburgensis]|uniref:Alanine--tRNA ligase n=2 Tax=Helicobacter TaxID=209 RepID=A0A4U8SZ16_9HELI|nr:alanine--tRNA ligase [Helicobacter magdeburgensis]TLD92275.1 alanine--tRNA ligase [Helicobacter magdeburgensis]
MKDIRALYLEFFKSKGHKVYDSMPLVPDDASLLFTNAGMVQFKDIFTGKIPIPSPNIATSSQLCIRAGGKHNDLENVGYTARHHTLFEMLGNFSFGAYFKKEAIAYAWEFVTEILGFDKGLLYVTIHESDDEAFELWQEHIEPERIKRMGDKDNFWQMGDTGPCGPCSEIYVDQGAEFFNGEEDYFGGEGDRFLEIWNLVFMQYERSADGTLTPLPKPSIDTGMGLERVIALKEGEINNFDSSLFAPIMQCIKELTGKSYYRDSVLLKNTMGFAKDIIDSCKKDIASFRVIADHARAVAFLLAQGVNFDKEGRGYVLRRILRRAVRHGYLLGLRKAFLYEVVGVVCDSMGGHYSYLIERKNALQEQCKAEEERFFETIESGMALFQAELEKLRGHSVLSDKSRIASAEATALTPSKLLASASQNHDFSSQSLECQDSQKVDSSNAKETIYFSGEVAFKLYDTYGFPLDLTQDMLRELGLSIDLQGFEKCMQEQKDRSKAHWKGSGDSVKDGDFNTLLSEFGKNEFVGYECVKVDSRILALLDSSFKRVESLQAGQEGWVMLESTPFYPESGGPVGDKGALFSDNSSLGNHCTDFTNFERTADLMSSSPSKFVKNSTSTTANTRIVDSTPCERELKSTSLKCQDSSDTESKVDSTMAESRPSRGAELWEQGGSSATAKAELEREERGTPLDCRKSGDFFGAKGSGEGINPFLREENNEKAELQKETTQTAQVLDTQKYFGLNLSKIHALSPLKTGDLVKAQVDSSRFEIAKHHSATHLLHYALRQILGSHIAQAGSLVESNRLRFDFSHPKALSVNELEQIEALVNSKIAESCPQVCETMGIEQAKAKGAMALFGEKYGESVRVITLGDSIELCGGIHIHNTAEIGSFYIVRESSVSSGVRRIEAVCGKAAYHYGKAALESIKTLKEQLKAQDVLQGVAKLQNALKEARDNANKAKQSVKSLDYEEVNGVKLIVLKLDSVEAKEAKDIIDRAKNENEKVAILLVTESGGKVSLTAGVKGISSLKAGAWVKQVAQILGGNGGGRDDFATAGGKITESSKVQEALDLAKQIARESLG